jgi:hypothetical protein
MMGFNRLKIFDSKTGERYLNLYAFDIQNGWNERCSGMYGLPDLDPTNEGLYLYQHADIPPMKLGSNDPTFWHGADHLSIMKAICSVDVDMKMMWDKCAYFLVDHCFDHRGESGRSNRALAGPSGDASLRDQ